MGFFLSNFWLSLLVQIQQKYKVPGTPNNQLFYGCSNWMNPNHCIKNDCFTKHPLKNGGLGYQVCKNHSLPKSYLGNLEMWVEQKNFQGFKKGPSRKGIWKAKVSDFLIIHGNWFGYPLKLSLVIIYFFSIREVENGCVWKVTILLEIHAFFTEPWLWEEGYLATSTEFSPPSAWLKPWTLWMSR